MFLATNWIEFALVVSRSKRLAMWEQHDCVLIC